MIIILTKKEKDALDAYLRGDTSMFGTPPEMMEILSEVITKAEDYFLECENTDDLGSDLLEWFFMRYLEQSGEDNERLNQLKLNHGQAN